MNFDDLEAEVQRMLEVDDVFVSRMTELQSLRNLLQEQKDFNETLEDQLKRARAVQMTIEGLLTRLELQIQRQLENVSEIWTKMCTKNSNNATSSEGISYADESEWEQINGYRETTDTIPTEDMQVMSSDDENEYQLDELAHPKPPKEHQKEPITSSQDWLNRKENTDSGQLNVRELKNVQVLCESDITQCNDELDLDPEQNYQFEQVSTQPRRIHPPKDNVEQSEAEGSLRKKQVRYSRKKDWRKVKVYSSSSANVVRKPSTQSCNICNKRFSCRSGLNKHLMIHTGEKPFKCNICETSFTQKCNLLRHSKLHVGEKPHKCDVCGASFQQSRHLSRHLKIHVGG